MANSSYIAMSGALAAEKRLEIAANNIANTNTTGFKGSRVTFSQFLTPTFGDRPIEKGVTAIDEDRVDTTEGTRIQTGNPLDVAIDGPGWFAVQGPQGPLLTRAGTFQLNPEGQLVDGSGLPVLQGSLEGGTNPIAIDPAGGPVSIGADGSITQGGAAVGQLLLLDAAPESLSPVGSSHYAAPLENLAAVEGPRVAAGQLEGSNVNPIKGMIELIELNKDYATSQKLMSQFRKLDEKVLSR